MSDLGNSGRVSEPAPSRFRGVRINVVRDLLVGFNAIFLVSGSQTAQPNLELAC